MLSILITIISLVVEITSNSFRFLRKVRLAKCSYRRVILSRFVKMRLNYYKVLGCSEDSTQEDIKHAYHRRLFQFHPDRNDTADIQEFHDVKEAWRILGCPQSRKKYDAACRQEQLEKEDSPVYARLSPDDLEESALEGTLFYRCKCGENYFVEREALRRKNTVLQVICDGCTLIILVET